MPVIMASGNYDRGAMLHPDSSCSLFCNGTGGSYRKGTNENGLETLSSI